MARSIRLSAASCPIRAAPRLPAARRGMAETPAPTTRRRKPRPPPCGPSVRSCRSDGASGRTPSRGIRSRVVLRQPRRNMRPGIRMEPPVSLPNATSCLPAATATVDPLARSAQSTEGRAGRTGVPNYGLYSRDAERQVLLEVRLCPTTAASAAASAARAPARHVRCRW